MSEWIWRFEAADGTELAGASLPSTVFPNQADAETWVGEAWPDLLDAGVDAVTLLRDGQVVYARMSLHPPL